MKKNRSARHGTKILEQVSIQRCIPDPERCLGCESKPILRCRSIYEAEDFPGSKRVCGSRNICVGYPGLGSSPCGEGFCVDCVSRWHSIWQSPACILCCGRLNICSDELPF